MSRSTKTSKNLTGHSTEEQLTLFQEDSHVKNIVRQASKPGMTHLKTKCLEYYLKCYQPGPSLKMLAILLIKNLPRNTTLCVHSWKISVTKCKRMILTLNLVDYQRWNGISGLLPRILASEYKGVMKKD